MKRKPILRVVAKFLTPLIILFALYVQFHGDYSPGGGFQAGVIFGAAFILYGLIFGVDAVLRVMSPAILRALASFGVLLYGGVGLLAILRGGAFLDYKMLHADPVVGQHLGIVLIELGVGFTVSAVMITIFIVFASRVPE